ncbi:MAG: TRAP transporter substrate-binding protein [Acetobacteraceae bacterium]|nr:TRAP transporter substrate-binding protein [Acetobacteraceae bacterium]
MRPITRRTLLRGTASVPIGAGLAPAIIGRANAAPLRMKLSSSQANDARYGNGRVFHDNLVKQLQSAGLGSQITIQFFPDNQLGQEIDVVNSVKLGVIDMMVTGTSIWADLVPAFGVCDLGYLFKDFPQQTKALDSGAAKPLEDMLLKGAKVHVAGWAYNFGARSVLCKTPVHGPEDLAGKKIRTLPSTTITEVLRLMGAAATPLAFGEIYTALQAGVLDGLEHDPPTILASKFFEAAKNYSLTEHIYSPLGLFLSDVTFQRIDPKLRDGLLEAAAKAASDTRAHGLTVAGEAIDELKKKGVTVIDPDRAAFRQRVLPQTDAFVKAHPETKPIVDIIQSTSV